jgi:hypothetical protein
MKLVLAAVLLLIAICVQAKDGCGVELEGGLRITTTALEFTEGDKTRYKIINDQTLVVNGRPLSLNPRQQLLVQAYATSIRALVPEVHQLTLDGVDLASEAVGMVFQELLEPDDQTAQKIRNELSLLRNDIEQGFASGRPITINQKGIDHDDFLGMDFESRISKIIDSSGKKIGWNLIKSLSESIFPNDDKRGNLETRLNKIGERMEREMKVRSEKMEKREDLVCRAVLALDAKEEALKQSITEISEFNFIAIKKISPYQHE